jgi:hypothetical protein
MHSRPLKASRFLAFAALTATAALAACGGGGSNGTPVSKAPVSSVTTPPATAGAGLAPATFTIKIPSANSSSTSRRTKTVNALTTSISFTLIKTAAGSVANATPVSFDLSSASTLCTPATGSGRTCSIGISAPLGDDIYSIQTFDVGGHKLGSSAVNITVLQNVANSAAISLGGTIAGIMMTALSVSADGDIMLAASGNPSVPSTARVLVIGVDNLQNVILTPDTFSSPILLAFRTVLQPLSNARRTRLLINPYVQATVTYANPIGGVTTSGANDQTGNVLVNSPGDIITLTALGPGPTANQSNELLGFVGSIPATLPQIPPTAGSVASSFSGVPLQVLAVPAPPPALTWQASQPGLTGGTTTTPAYTFASVTSPAVNLSLFDSAGGSVTLTSTDCLLSGQFDQPASFPINMALNGPTFTLETLAHSGATPTPNPNPSIVPTPFPLTAVTCHITATTPGSTSQLTVFINNVTGQVQ